MRLCLPDSQTQKKYLAHFWRTSWNCLCLSPRAFSRYNAPGTRPSAIDQSVIHGGIRQPSLHISDLEGSFASGEFVAVWGTTSRLEIPTRPTTDGDLGGARLGAGVSGSPSLTGIPTGLVCPLMASQTEWQLFLNHGTRHRDVVAGTKTPRRGWQP